VPNATHRIKIAFPNEKMTQKIFIFIIWGIKRFIVVTLLMKMMMMMKNKKNYLLGNG